MDELPALSWFARQGTMNLAAYIGQLWNLLHLPTIYFIGWEVITRSGGAEYSFFFNDYLIQ